MLGYIGAIELLIVGAILVVGAIPFVVVILLVARKPRHAVSQAREIADLREEVGRLRDHMARSGITVPTKQRTIDTAAHDAHMAAHTAAHESAMAMHNAAHETAMAMHNAAVMASNAAQDAAISAQYTTTTVSTEPPISIGQQQSCL